MPLVLLRANQIAAREEGVSHYLGTLPPVPCRWSADPYGLAPPRRVSSGTPHCPKLGLIRPKSVMSARQSPLYSALGLYPTSPHTSPKLALCSEKSVIST